ncbi:MAG: pyridoxal 5'-phosphate synthase glutaminase subunit PdxT [Bryobacteraceae bacterium]|nr:pyridoxal 5'-phosphate synthase glutaminase subunit PdxT [Bryobacteraceae bacterium]
MSAPIGVLALQGDFEAHEKALARAGASPFPVRTREELERAAGLVIPGGESTTMLKLLHLESLFEPLREYCRRRPIFGTCAGAILLASEVSHPAQESLSLVDMAVERNAYGRQLDSRVVQLPLNGDQVEAVFIRAPIIRRVGSGGNVLATYLDDPVLVDFGRHLVATFHPELTPDPRIHRLFLEKVEEWR